MRLLTSAAAFAVSAVCAGAAAAQETQTYAYDVHGRLTGVTRTTGSTTRTTAYTLDDADNRTQRATTVSSGGGLAAAPQAPAEPEARPTGQAEAEAPVRGKAARTDAARPASSSPAVSL